MNITALQLINAAYHGPAHHVEPLGDPLTDPEAIAAELAEMRSVRRVEDAIGWPPYTAIIVATDDWGDWRYYLARIEADPDAGWVGAFQLTAAGLSHFVGGMWRAVPQSDGSLVVTVSLTVPGEVVTLSFSGEARLADVVREIAAFQP